MHFQNQKGFTIIEVILFFALSSAFILIAFLGIRSRTANVQFTDSMRSLHSYLESEQDKVMNGVNSNLQSACNIGLPTGGNPDCVLLGRVATFGHGDSVVTTDVIRAEKLSSTAFGDTDSDVAKIIKSNPQSDRSPTTYDISWNTEFNVNKSENAPHSISKPVSIGWFRSPDSTRVVPIVLGDGVNLSSSSFITTSGQVALADQVGAKFCFTGESKKYASVNFDQYSAITLEFDDVDCMP